MAAPKPAVRVERTAFRSSRALDFASVEELTRETGQPPTAWPLVILKELVDNALDACEEAGIAPVILVRVDQDGITVTDNGPGLPAETVAGVVDFQVRVSSRSAYVAPDRGAQGNALKTLIAMPFVLDGTAGQVEITARGLRHRITFGLDALRQHPEVALEAEPAPAVRRGTSLLVRWPDSASSTLTGAEAGFYRIAATYAFLNPHLTLTLRWFEREEAAWLPAEPTWAKWKPTRPTSPHWYTPERLARLIAAYLAHDEAAGRPSARTVRDFVALFDGLTGTAKRKAVLDATGLHRAPLRALVGADGLDMAAVARLLGFMRAASKPVRPDKLGLIGGAALRSRLEEHGVEPDSFEYRRKMGTTTSGLPWVVEAAFGWRPDAAGRHLITGVNWSPGVNNPFRALRHLGDGLDGLLADRWADEDAPVLVAVHLAIPGASYTDRGKTALSVPYDVGEALFDAVTAVTKRWARQMEAEIRDHGRKLRRREAMTAAAKPERVTLKDAAWSVMRAAYMAASAGDTLPANARQIYYAARPAILAMTGKDRLDDQYFCQTLLPDYLAEHPEETDAWDVVFDARGHLLEPHTGREVALGTLDVRHYLGDRPQEWLSEAEPSAFSWPTSGPKHRFGAVLFIEKEGFDPLLRAARLAERYDVAIMSTKGMSVTAARLLIDRLTAEHPGLKVLVAHDFDVSGFSIFGTLGGDTRRYAFENAVEVIDIGLRLADARAEGLQDEPVGHKGDWARIAATLRRHGATEEEVAFLRTKRVEINAFTSDALVAWLERKLEEHRVRKIIPDADTLDAAARAAWRLAARADLLARRAADLDREADEAPLPPDLRARVEALLAERPEMPWDEAVEEVVAELRGPTVDEGDVGDEG